MSKPRGLGPAPGREVGEAFFDFLSAVARFLLWGGLILTLTGAGFLIYTSVAFSGPNPPASVEAAMSNIAIFDKVLLAGVLGLGVGSTFLFWGESALGAAQLIAALVMYLSPLILSMAGISNQSGNRAATAALDSATRSGLILGAFGLVVLLIDLYLKSKQRVSQGAKADLMRYGKGVKEEVDRQNVFLGKCWQLPFCRKFVRERCPIYHARRTCWRELTGCMCEEEVIRNAMENKPIPKDQLMAANYIPRNNKLTDGQKRERCKSCVIFNEHQKHKYKALMPAMLALFGLIYFLGHGVLITGVAAVINTLDKLIGRATFRAPSSSGTLQNTAGGMFHELLLACVMIVLFAYALKFLEYLVFKLKI